MFFRILFAALTFHSLTALAVGERCGAYSCLETTPSESGYQLKLKARSPRDLMCYIRWENFRYFEQLTTETNESKTYTLRRGYSPRGVSWRCSPTETCVTWMKNAGLCGLS